MLVRERIGKQEELARIKERNQNDVAKGKRVNRKAEDGGSEDVIKVGALDRSYKDVLSASPLKMRSQWDIGEEGKKSEEKDLGGEWYSSKS